MRHKEEILQMGIKSLLRESERILPISLVCLAHMILFELLKSGKHNVMHITVTVNIHVVEKNTVCCWFMLPGLFTLLCVDKGITGLSIGGTFNNLAPV